jgi:hypothetical protein
MEDNKERRERRKLPDVIPDNRGILRWVPRQKIDQIGLIACLCVTIFALHKHYMGTAQTYP